jgi:ParB family chromosome partitioning protein
MSQTPTAPKIEAILIELIDVVNPRARSRRVFQEIVESIAKVGLKRPITVARRQTNGGVRYDLVCGQGRLEAFRELGQAAIPAAVVDAEGEDCLVMGLVENVARRQHQALHILHDIDGMRGRGHSEADIARKTGLSLEYVRGVLRLITKGETRLLQATESGQIPVSVAVQIADAEEGETQHVLQEAYERKLLRGHSLLAAKRLVERRKRGGKQPKTRDRPRGRPLSVDTLIRTYQQDVDKKRSIVRRAETVRNRLLFITEALRTLYSDDAFVNLVRAEGLYTLPRGLSERIHGDGFA